ncbi:histidine utilization repressor [Comamonas testosteroni]|uniref:Histidine utilization repressor n=2 Tax=Comamonas testosteroni TaxID=285 RepID=B7X083_COMTK|nr:MULTISPECIES: histidine utilization repressor [Comamonas]AIJ44360.1 histidine utilization repressor [Comamonas testosteroni TK102]EED69991.1 transcriptional regulator, histidine utilization repressor, GntR family [Comamonas testosteroni KF-1]MPS89855.1 histidine utilization repressor [Comamonas sp.]TYK71569.1 histidine utilization repressor [Comamonas sp. Z3]WQG67927.1 histidine utilization repressor [Comamonas testosteroni]
MSRTDTTAAVPAFQRIKDHVLQQIHSGVWQEGQAIPSEAALVKQFNVARMTVNRALRELSDEKTLTRVQGSGTFVAQQKYQATLVELRNIADEIAARGHRHRGELQRLERCKVDTALLRQFELNAAPHLFHSVVVHFENDVPIQVEDRYVNPAVAPDYLSQDFASQTPNAYLVRVAPLQGVSFSIEASMPTPEVAELLRMEVTEPCLVLRRRTRSQGQVASVSALWHPASRYQFAGNF